METMKMEDAWLNHTEIIQCSNCYARVIFHKASNPFHWAWMWFLGTTTCLNLKKMISVLRE